MYCLIMNGVDGPEPSTTIKTAKGLKNSLSRIGMTERDESDFLDPWLEKCQPGNVQKIPTQGGQLGDHIMVLRTSHPAT